MSNYCQLNTCPGLFRNQRGVAMMEAAIVFTMFFLVVVTFVDCARYFGARALLLKGAQMAANVAAKKSNFDVDIYSLSSANLAVPNSPDSQAFDDYKAARASVAATASNLALATMFSKSPSMMKLEEMKSYDQAGGNYGSATNLDALILRPGECGRRSDNSPICHPLRCPNGGSFGCSASARGLSETMSSMLKQMPIMVVARGVMQGISPLLRNVPIEVTAMAWREDVVNQGFKEAAIDPLNSAQNIPPLTPYSPGGGGGPGCVSGCPSGYRFDGCQCQGNGS